MISFRFCFFATLLSFATQALTTTSAPVAAGTSALSTEANQKTTKKRKTIRSSSQKIGQSNNPALRFSNDDDEPEVKNFSGSIEVSRSNSLYDLANGSKYQGMDYITSLIYKLKAGWVTTQLGVSQDLDPKAEKQAVMNDSNLTYVQKPFLLYKNSQSATVSWSPSVSMVLPISEKSQQVDHLQTAFVATANLKVFAAEGSKLRGGGLVASLSGAQFFHRFETDVNGAILVRNSSNQGVTVFYSLSDFTLTLSQIHRVRWNYQNDVKNSFDLTQDLTYSASKDWSVSLGHSNSGSTLKPNGSDSNIALINEETSLVYLGTAYSF